MHQLPPRCITRGAAELRLQSCVWGAAWLRGAEATAAAAHNITLYDLMKRAGRAVFDVCRRTYPKSRHWLVLCGAGNNGGDGFVVARHAALSAGIRVTVVTAASKSNSAMPPEAAAAFQALTEHMLVQPPPPQQQHEDEGEAEEETVGEALGVVTIQDASEWQKDPIADDIDLVVDGLLGTGITGAPRAEYAVLIDRVNSISAPRVAVDIPSGLNAETGYVEGACVRADHTVTFIALKPGLLTACARDYVGELHYDCLRLEAWMLEADRQKEIFCRRLIHSDLKQLLPHRRSACSHKGHNGKLLLIGGCESGGAIIMAAEAALRTGAGLVRVLTHADHVAPLISRCPEVMASELTEDSFRYGLQWATAVAVGPGLGVTKFTYSILEELQRYCQHEEIPSVWDADALVMLATEYDLLYDEKPDHVWARPVKTRILTPHPREASALLDCTVEEVEQDRFRAAKAIAARYGGIVLLKGPGTVLHAAEDIDTQVGLTTAKELLLPHFAVADVGNSGLASGGTGDVLTGIIAGLLAQRIPLWSAACTGCLVHGTAGDLAAAALGGERGLTATMLFNHIPSCVNPLGGCK